MPAKPIPPSELQQAINAAAIYPTNSGAAIALGISESAFYRRLRLGQKQGMVPGAEIPAAIKAEEEAAVVEEEFKFTEQVSKGTATIFSIGTGVRTAEEAIAKAEINLDEWEITEQTVNSWPTTMKLKASDGSTSPETVYNWQVKLKLRRRFAAVYSEVGEALIKRMAEHAPPVYDRKRKPKTRKGGHLLEISLADPHFGKYAWRAETGTDYDTHIAETLYCKAAELLVERCQNFDIDEVVLPVGNDFFNIDNDENTTTKGTAQDVDTRFPKVFEDGCMAVIHAVDMLREIAPVKLLYVPGNHDLRSAWFLCKYLSAWYQRDTRVQVDTCPKTRKYLQFGNTLLGWTHGSEEPFASLPTIMASEQAQAWADSKYREWHVGHFHRKRQTHYIAGDTFNAVQVQVLPSLCGTDAWHYRKGYVKVERAAEAHLWSRGHGKAAQFSVNVDELTGG